jgi:two-component system cell cycle response regulator
MKILIAEDQPTSALLLRHSLARLGHQVDVAGDGEVAWEMIRDSDARLLISDWMMPRLDGPDLCRRIREAALDRYIYIILLTTRDRQEDKLKGLRAGADDFLTKPLDPEELAVRLEVACRILAVHENSARQNLKLAELAATDELTNVKNRRRFREDLDLLFSQAGRYNSPLSLIMLDIDHFKQYNDTFGHPAGDDVLRGVGATLQAELRIHDVVARFGGEEFIVLLPATGSTEALQVAERLRASLANRDWPHRKITASFGVSMLGPTTPTAADLVDQADRALYQSKEQGRDRVTLFQP